MYINAYIYCYHSRSSSSSSSSCYYGIYFIYYFFPPKGQETQSVFLFLVCPGMTCMRCRRSQTKKLKACNLIKMA